MRCPPLLKDNAGFTLTEMMVALVVMIVAMVGLLQAIGIALEHNLRNQEREEAVYLGEKYMNELRGKSFDSYSASYSSFAAGSAVRGGGLRYTVERSTAPLGADTRLLMVTVKWTFKQVEYQNRVTATVSQSPS
ncbi:pilus assembly protein PilV [Geomonas silvestris]|uniref:Pilus assembly protein PilV n=1 Tax=Geomonas silvestris TaxID=2740184 RepID=A0A6V8MED2_9BACT|nr:prepilin-type N-terminal cleavage/methylation domain-containing protein [Geomonas silvestris]GFO58059.1 pilus assembly protein PilV [Geomonas silvestris]